jgi:hypothetical protein
MLKLLKKEAPSVFSDFIVDEEKMAARVVKGES